jgi:hypothetical protein
MSRLLYCLAWLQTEQPGVTYIDVAPKEPEHNLIWFLLSTFVLIGIALLITAGIGAGTGFLRILIVKYFPGNKLNGPEYEATTLLHLHDHPEQETPPS